MKMRKRPFQNVCIDFRPRFATAISFSDAFFVVCKLALDLSSSDWIRIEEERLLALTIQQLHQCRLNALRLNAANRMPHRSVAAARVLRHENAIFHNQLMRLWNRRHFSSDFQLRIESGDNLPNISVPCHRFMIATRCEYFAALLISNLSEATNGIAPVSKHIFQLTSASESVEKRFQIVSLILRFMYTGRMPRAFRGVEDFVELIEVASYFRLGDASHGSKSTEHGEFLSLLTKKIDSFVKSRPQEEVREILSVLDDALAAQQESSVFEFLISFIRSNDDEMDTT
jgi:hypothetical protein